MKQIWKRMSVLALSMVLAATPAGVYADNVQSMDQTGEETVDVQQKEATQKNKFSGTCGKRLTWELNSKNGVLKISGTGAMENYIDESEDDANDAPMGMTNAPWRSYRTQIKRVEVSNGVTQIGSYAFIGCDKLELVTIPESVRGIDWLAFLDCGNINAITVDENNAKFCSQDGSLYNKDKTKLIRAAATLTEVPKGVINIGDGAFSGEKSALV
ncbi:MAG: leucine-rich repeat domain-containing protein [Lachnospiraceae bacterium]